MALLSPPPMILVKQWVPSLLYSVKGEQRSPFVSSCALSLRACVTHYCTNPVNSPSLLAATLARRASPRFSSEDLTSSEAIPV